MEGEEEEQCAWCGNAIDAVWTTCLPWKKKFCLRSIHVDDPRDSNCVLLHLQEHGDKDGDDDEEEEKEEAEEEEETNQPPCRIWPER